MPHEKICIFLRGVNVNGISIRMQDLRNLFESIGFQDVKTVLATGNVILSKEENTESLDFQEQIQSALRAAFHYDAHIIVRTIKELKATYQTAATLNVSANHHLYLLLCQTDKLYEELHTLFQSVPHASEEKIVKINRDIIWIVPKGETLDSEFGSMILGRQKYKEQLTSRNINTIQKILAAAGC